MKVHTETFDGDVQSTIEDIKENIVSYLNKHSKKTKRARFLHELMVDLAFDRVFFAGNPRAVKNFAEQIDRPFLDMFPKYHWNKELWTVYEDIAALWCGAVNAM